MILFHHKKRNQPLYTTHDIYGMTLVHVLEKLLVFSSKKYFKQSNEY